MPAVVGLAAAACVFAGAVGGLYLHRLLPPEHVTKETQEVIRLCTGSLSVLAALVLGLLITTARTSSDTTTREVQNFAAELVILDGVLRDYGPEADAARARLRAFAQQFKRDIWPGTQHAPAHPSAPAAGAMLEEVRRMIRSLVPQAIRAQQLQLQATQSAAQLLRQRQVLIEQDAPTVQPLILGWAVILVTLIFASFGLNMPINRVVLMAFLLSALAIGSAVFIIMEIDSPFSGLLVMSDRPMASALAELNR
ncbi:hypothetical protein ACFOD4_17845 [Pseudoroseomonas globiformis]|uniref:DUF4239 domain-containing protein n=1 Tax=Teichococcus globiformis TaxID=2307229 RepID=A0ABV7G2K8_9PROT